MKRIIIFGLIVGIVSVGMSSCGLFGTSMADRVAIFEDDLNGSRANIIDNVHPDAPGYNTANSDTYWNGGGNVWDPLDKPFSITNVSEGSSSVSATFNSGVITGGTISFDMKDDGGFMSEDWKIWSCSVGGTGQF